MKSPNNLALPFALALALSPATSHAQLTYDQAVAYCKSLGEMARAAMEQRQKGVTLEEQLAALQSMENEHFEQLGAKLVGAAYEKTAYTDPASQKRAIEDFRNEYEHACYKLYVK